MDYTNDILIFSTATDFAMLQTYHNIFTDLPAKYRNCKRKSTGFMLQWAKRANITHLFRNSTFIVNFHY